MATIVGVMGVSGSGKTTVGTRLADAMHCAYLEGDALHSPDLESSQDIGLTRQAFCVYSCAQSRRDASARVRDNHDLVHERMHVPRDAPLREYKFANHYIGQRTARYMLELVPAHLRRGRVG